MSQRNPLPTVDARVDGLSPEERAYLLLLARRAIRGDLDQKPADVEDAPDRLASLVAGAFVSLHRGPELRGCIGSFAKERPLPILVRDLAIAAARSDPRFSPVSEEEIPSLTIEISVLSDPEPADACEVVCGRHGVSVEREGLRGVLLPQVAGETGWDRDRLLTEACRKAGLPADAWRDPSTRIFVFRAEHFTEPCATRETGS